MTLYFVAGEASADNHGAALMRSLRKLAGGCEIQFVGRGGPQMQTVAGEQFTNWISDAAVLGLWEVIRKYRYFRQQFRDTLNEIQNYNSDAVILMDYPGFNLRLARALQKRSPRQKIIYYISPQVWAWNRGRIKRMAGLLDLMLCIFPFEADFYHKSGLRAVFVGHPMVEGLRVQKIETARDLDLIGLFPGSRLREVRKIFPVMLETVNLLQRRKSSLRFEVAAASEPLAAELNKILTPHFSPLPAGREEGRVRGAGESMDQHAIQIKVGETAAIMQRAFVGIVASGSATLEAAYFRLPFVLIYKVAWPTYLAARLVISVKYLGMPNVLAGKEVVREFIQHRAKPSVIAEAVAELLENVNARDRMISEFDAIVHKLGEHGASKKAARAILEEINEQRSLDRPSLGAEDGHETN